MGSKWSGVSSSILPSPSSPGPASPSSTPSGTQPLARPPPHSQDTLSLMVASVLTPAPGKVTRHVRLVPWSWGLGVRVSTEEWGLLGCGEVRAILVQEKVGGVGRMDQNIAKYKVKIRGMKWYSSFIGYVIDAALNNAWQLHRICCHDAQVDLLAFRRYVACVYLESNADTSSQGRRSRRLETESRFDMIGHWIIHQDKRTRCALCHSQTNTRCEKCQKGVHAKCFRAYHIR